MVGRADIDQNGPFLILGKKSFLLSRVFLMQTGINFARKRYRSGTGRAAAKDVARLHSFSVNFFRSSAAILSASSCAFFVCFGAVTTVGRHPSIGSRRPDTNTPPISSL